MSVDFNKLNEQALSPQSMHLYAHYNYNIPLSTGQYANIVFHYIDDLYESFDWFVSASVSDYENAFYTNQEQRVFDEYSDEGVTGRSGIEGLVVIYRVIKWFIEHKMEDNETIKVVGYNKRGDAYKYLERLGFKSYTEVDYSRIHGEYTIRNMFLTKTPVKKNKQKTYLDRLLQE